MICSGCRKMYLVDAMEASLEDDDAHTYCNVSKASEFILMSFDYKPTKNTHFYLHWRDEVKDRL
jgi:hypothetical protein